MKLSRIAPSAGVLAALLASPALAQDDFGPTSEEEIVVTGTSLRGVAPAGSNVLGLGEEEIRATGATTTTQVLSSLPQLLGFNSTPSIIATNSFRSATLRPNIRGLDSGSISGGSSTLLLMDGHRLPGAGIQQTSPDSDVLPPSVIQRVEVVTDGGSSVYGSDAVGGVVNYITRRSFDGFQVDARQGYADDYQSSDVTLTAGEDWGAGSVYIAYNYLQNDAIFGRDRDYIQRIDWTTLEPLDLTCSPANISVGGAFFVNEPGFPAGPQRCDRSDNTSYIPQVRKDSVFVGFTQDLSGDVRFDLRAFYTHRIVKGSIGSYLDESGAVTIAPSNPYHIDSLSAGSQTVFFDYSALIGDSTIARNDLEVWGFTPELTVDLPSDWQLRALLNYGASSNTTDNLSINRTALQAAGAASDPARALNPFNLLETNSDVFFGNEAIGLVGIFEQTYGRGDNQLGSARAVVDGPLFSLPAGQVRVALGAEYIADTYDSNYGTAPLGREELTPGFHGHRTTDAYFAELNVPIVSGEMEVLLVHSLALSLSGRYDHYSDFGGTTNPRVGITYEPLEWFTIRGNWGESFQAPSLANVATSGVAGTRVLSGPFLGAPDGFPPPAGAFTNLFLQGSKPLVPETATSYSVGFEVRPPIIPDLQLSATYYNIEFENRILFPVPLGTFFTDFPDLWTANPTRQQIQDYCALAANPEFCDSLGSPVYIIYDTRFTNAARLNVDGVDASVRYAHDTAFGSIYANFNGTYRLHERKAVSAVAPLGPNLADRSSRTRLTGTVGAQIGDLLAQTTVNYSGGFELPSALPTGQTEVDSYTTVDLFFQYEFENAVSWGDGLSVSLGVNNLLDQEPSRYEGSFDPSHHGWTQGSVVGRLVQVGLSKRF